ncbi:hypothetical protein ACR3K2_23760 [Cryptosporidium serpentis]
MEHSNVILLDDSANVDSVKVKFEGLKHVNSSYLNFYNKKFENIKDMGSLLQAVKGVHEGLISTGVFSDVIPYITTDPEVKSKVDVKFHCVENKFHYTIGSSVNKKGRIGVEASAYIPGIFGSLSTAKLNFEASGQQSGECGASIFTPNIFGSNFNMLYNIYKTMIDHRQTSSYTEKSFGGILRISDMFGRNSICFESRARDIVTTRFPSNDEDNLSSFASILKIPSQSIKNSIGYSWNRIKQHNPSTDQDNLVIEKSIEPLEYIGDQQEVIPSMAITQLSSEYAGLNGDVTFLKFQGSHKWRGSFAKYINFKFVKNLNFEFNMAFGILLPNIFSSGYPLVSTIHDRFFVGGNFGYHNCLRGFAARGIGPCELRCDSNQEQIGTSKPIYDYLGGEGFSLAEFQISYPLKLDFLKFGIMKPHLTGFISAASIIEKTKDLIKPKCDVDRCTILLQGLRASTGIGLMFPINSANLSVTLSTPLKYCHTDLLENVQLGIRLVYSPI